jgi:hypothetical protein
VAGAVLLAMEQVNNKASRGIRQKLIDTFCNYPIAINQKIR